LCSAHSHLDWAHPPWPWNLRVRLPTTPSRAAREADIALQQSLRMLIRVLMRIVCIKSSRWLRMGQTRDLGQFDGDGGSFATADAQRGDAALQLAALERMHERGDDARARSPDRMTEGAGAAVDVDLFVRQTDIAHRRHR